MNILRVHGHPSVLLCFATLALLLVNVIPAQAQSESTNGTVVSSSRNTLTVRTSDDRFHLFVFDRNTVRPTAITVGSQVTVTSSAGDEAGVRIANDVRLLEAAAASQTRSSAPIPADVRRIERDIERQVRRFQFGVRAGVALDPELVMLGVQAQVGPFFNRDVFFRPNVEFAFGEVTALFAINPEVIYRLPISSRQGRWSTYLGAGPGFNFLHQNFEREDGTGKRIDFGDFHSDTGLNILGGLRYRNGMFAELKTSVYSDPSPTLRLIIGYNF